MVQEKHKQIDDLLAEAEKLAAGGQVEQLMVLMLAVEEAKKVHFCKMPTPQHAKKASLGLSPH